MKHDFSCWESCTLDFPPASRRKMQTPLRHCQMNCLQSYQHYSVTGDESIFRCSDKSTLFTKPSRLNTLQWIPVRFWIHCNYFNRTDDVHLNLLTLSTQTLYTDNYRQKGSLFTKTAHPFKPDKLFIYLYIYLLQYFPAARGCFLMGLAISMSITGLLRSFWLGSSASCSSSGLTSVSPSWEAIVHCELLWLSGSITSRATVKSRRFLDTETAFERNPVCVWVSLFLCARGSVGEASMGLAESLWNGTSDSESWVPLLAGVGDRCRNRLCAACSSVLTSSSNSLNDFWWRPAVKSL